MAGKNKKPDKNRRGGLGIFFLPKPQGQKHKHKKNKYYVNERDRSPTPTRSIMSSGDSPSHHNRTAEAYDYNPSETKPQPLEAKPLALPVDGRSSPIPTTSKEVAVQSSRTEEKVGEKLGDKGGKGEIQASVLVEPGEGKEKDEENKDFGSPTLNHSEGGGDHLDKEGEKRGKGDDSGFDGKDKKDRKDDKFRKNGNIDKLDGVWLPKDPKKCQDEQDDDNCIVKCLYVTMTCCECSIM